MTAIRKTITVDGSPYCADVAGSLPGNLTIANAIAGACAADPPSNPPGNPPTSAPEIIMGPDSIARRLLRTATVTWGSIGQGRSKLVSMLEYDQVYGRGAAADAPRPWPGVGGSAPTWNMGADQYVCLHFRTPHDVAGTTAQFINPSFVGGARPPLTMAISTIPGDFSRGLPTPGSIKENVANSDANLVGMKFTPNAPGSWANLKADTDYYVNILITNPRAVVAGKPIIVGPSRIG